MTQFGDYAQSEHRSRDRRAIYYALIDQSAINAVGEYEGDTIVFDAFQESALRSPLPRLDVPQQSDFSDDERYPVAVFSAPRAELLNRFPAANADYTTWLRITVADRTDGSFEANFLGDSSGDRPYAIAEVAVADGDEAAALDALVQIPNLTPTTASGVLRDALNGADRLQVSVVDVGQAGLCLLYEPYGRPRLFFDLGWPTNANLSSAPTERPDLGCADLQNVPVVLSHWDWDHCGMVYEKIEFLAKGGWSTITWSEGALNRPWVVPGVGKSWGNVKLSPMHWRLALALQRRNRLHVWGNVEAMDFGPLSIYRVRPKRAKVKGDKNQNALAMVVHDPGQSSGAYPPPKRRAVLLPGDADYKNIPPLGNRAQTPFEFNGLVATHHGGKFTVKSCPAGSGTAVLAISVGTPNGYGHPNLRAVTTYIINSWQSVARTDQRVRCANLSCLLINPSLRGNVGIATAPLALGCGAYSSSSCLCAVLPRH